jgi:hypothetical protein
MTETTARTTTDLITPEGEGLEWSLSFLFYLMAKLTGGVPPDVRRS